MFSQLFHCSMICGGFYKMSRKRKRKISNNTGPKVIGSVPWAQGTSLARRKPAPARPFYIKTLTDTRNRTHVLNTVCVSRWQLHQDPRPSLFSRFPSPDSNSGGRRSNTPTRQPNLAHHISPLTTVAADKRTPAILGEVIGHGSVQPQTTMTTSGPFSARFSHGFAQRRSGMVGRRRGVSRRCFATSS